VVKKKMSAVLGGEAVNALPFYKMVKKSGVSELPFKLLPYMKLKNLNMI